MRCWGWATVFYALGEYEKAREAWESAQQPEASDPLILISLGDAALAAGDA